MDHFAISHSPSCVSSNYLQAIINTSPGVGGAAAKLGFENISIREVFCLEDFFHPGVLVGEEHPTLLS